MCDADEGFRGHGMWCMTKFKDWFITIYLKEKQKGKVKQHLYMKIKMKSEFLHVMSLELSF